MAITKSFSKTAKTCKVTFTLPKAAAPKAKVVKVVGDFNNWNWKNGIPLKAGKDEFKGQAELNPGQRYEFRYCIDNKFWDNDWNADEYVSNPFGVDNSVVIIPEINTPNSKKNTTTKKTSSAKNNSKTRTKANRSTSTKKESTLMSGTKRKASKIKIDFTCIEGVGPKINQILMKAGYKTFEDLSSAKINDLKKVLNDAGPRYQMHNPKFWAKQAKMAAKGEWTKLQEFKDMI